MVGKRHAVAALYYGLAFSNQVHEFDPYEHCLRRAKRFEAKHRLGHPFDGTMILLYDIVEVFDLSNLDWDFSMRIQLVERCLVCAAFIHRHFFRNIVVTPGLGKEAHVCLLVALSCQLKVDVPCLSTAR